MSEMEQYLTKSKAEKLLIIGAGVLFLAVGCYMYFVLKTWGGLIAMAVGVLALYGGLTAGSSDRAAMQKLEDEGIRSRAEADFASAVSVANDRIRIGEEFIFRCSYPKLIRCRDVKKFHYIEQSTQSGNNHVVEGRVYLTMTDGSSENLFEEHQNRQEDAELAAQLLRKRNPNIELDFFGDHGILDGAINLVKKLTNKDE